MGHRTQITLTDEQYADLKQLLERAGATQAELARGAVSVAYGFPTTPPRGITRLASRSIRLRPRSFIRRDGPWKLGVGPGKESHLETHRSCSAYDRSTTRPWGGSRGGRTGHLS